jgi:S-adenosylmethionine hydrolase
MRLVTLTTDFGHDSPYVAELKGTLISLLGAVQLIDVTHTIAPQDREQAAWELAQVVPAFPPGTLHIVVVDPGVGTVRGIVAGWISGHRFVAPDNGVLSVLLDLAGESAQLITLDKPGYWREQVSSTFHGRDIMAPVAAHWLAGTPLSDLGQPQPLPQRLSHLWPAVEHDPGLGSVVRGKVVRVDRFGNLITNIALRHLDSFWSPVDAPSLALPDGTHLVVRHTYADVPVDHLLALIGSGGYLELAVNQGSAAQRLGAGRGLQVLVLSSRGGRSES